MLKKQNMSFKNFLSLLIAIVLSPFAFTQFDLNTNNGQTVTAAGCTGTLTDTPSGNYSSGSTQTITIQSPNTGEGVCLDFTQWDLDFSIFDSYPNGMTNLRFYDGNSTSSPLIEGATGDWDVNQSSSIGNEYDFTGPGMVCSSGGPLTIEFVRNGSGTGFSANITCLIPPSTNTCSINISADQTTICDGETVNLTVTGELTSPLLDNNFNDGTIGTGWSSSINGRFDNPCEAGLDGSTHFWIGTNPSPRDFTSIPFDVSLGGSVYFEIDFSDQGNGAPCEGPDLTTEGVYFQYSVDGGTNWITLHYFFPEEYTEGSNNIHSWQGYYFAIPAAAQTASTQFRWTQRRASSNTTDHWGLDNIKIVSPKQTTIRIKENSPTGTVIASSLTSPLNYSVTPSTTTTYYATISDGVDSCTQQVTVTVNPSTVPTFTPPSNLCENGPSYNLPTSSEDTPAITGSWDSAAATTTSSGTTTYTFTPDPGQCANTTTMNITVDPSITPTFTAVPDICSGDMLSPLPTTSNNSITGSWGPALNNTSTTTYTFTPDAPQCASNQNLTITVNPNEDATFTLTPTCDGATASITGTTGGTFSFTTPPGDAAVIDASTGTVTGGTSGNTYDITYTTSGTCTASTNQTATATNSDDATFTLTPTCDGASASISGTAGGTFSFTTPPVDAAVIDASTGTVTGGTSGNTYDITYATSGTCAASSNLTATATNSDDATFTLTPTCDGATASISGTTGGTFTFTFTTPPSDAAVIDASTGTVTGGTSGNTYDITYATSGACAASSNLTTTATNADDATFTLTPTCDGSTASISGTTGGTFSFTTPPSDAAVIDANSGTITGGSSGSTYDITYATTGTCAANTNQTVSSLITPTITSQPQDTPVCAASPTSFSVVASNGVNYQWEMRTNSTGTFAPLSDAGVYSNTQTSTLNISNCTGLNGLEFRVIVSDASGNCSITSHNAVLTVNVIETPTISCGTSTLSSVEFNWSALTGATSYSIAYSVNSGASQNGGTVTSPSYTLSSLNPGDVVDITINTTGSTSCYAQNSFTCVSQTCTSPTIINQPTLSPSCSGEPEVLSVTASSEATGYRWEISTDGGNSFTPLFNAALYSGVNTSSLSITDNSLLDTYQYRVVISEANNTCPTTSNPVTFVVNPSPTISGTLVACPTLTSQLSATTSPSLSTPWISASTNVATIDNTGIVTAESVGTSLITYTDINGCTETVTMTVPEDDTPIISCGTSTTSSVTFDWNVPASVLSFDITYSINGQTPINAGNQNLGTYSLNNLTVDDTVSITINTNGTGCYQQATGVCYSESCTPSQALFLPEPKTITSSNPITTFINSSVNSNTYLWDFGDGNTSSQANPNHEYTINNETENYEVTLIAYNVDGCNDTTSQTVLVKEELIYYVPNTFTPDGDEFNNEFKPIFYSGHDPYSYTMVIFNRWGEIVYETSNLDIGWKGTYGDSGDIVQDGVYIWKINFNEKGIDKNIEITGHVLLIK